MKNEQIQNIKHQIYDLYMKSLNSRNEYYANSRIELNKKIEYLKKVKYLILMN